MLVPAPAEQASGRVQTVGCGSILSCIMNPDFHEAAGFGV